MQLRPGSSDINDGHDLWLDKKHKCQGKVSMIPFFVKKQNKTKWKQHPSKKPYLYVFVYKYTNYVSMHKVLELWKAYHCGMWLEDGDKWKANTEKSGENLLLCEIKGKYVELLHTPLPHSGFFQMVYPQRDPFGTSWLTSYHVPILSHSRPLPCFCFSDFYKT